MELFSNLALGAQTAFTITNLFYCFMGCLLGTIVGVLPGIGVLATISILLPATFTMPPETSLIALAGIFYGAQYGGSTTAILVNMPGENSAVITTIDGYQMARNGEAGKALAAAALGSFFAGTVATVLIATLAPTISEFALGVGAVEYFSLMILGLVAAVALARGSLLRGIGMVLVGMMIGTIGTDANSGFARFTFGSAYLLDGVGLVVVALGVFAAGEVIDNLQNESDRDVGVKKVTGLMPRWSDIKRMAPSVLRGTSIGSVLGVLPGTGATISTFVAYAVESKISKNRHLFGKGAIEGVAAPESANNAAAQVSFVPMLTLGLPSNAVMALMIGALMLQGIQPGPQVINNQPTLFWGLIVSMWVGNLMLLILNLPLISIWVKLLSVPYHYLFPAILVFSCIGVFSLDGVVFDIYLMALFGVIGFVFRKLNMEPAPLILGLVLGPLMEIYLRRALLLARGDTSIFVTSPASLILLSMALAAIIAVSIPAISKRRDAVIQEDD